MTDEERKLVLHYLKYEAEHPRLYSNSEADCEYWKKRVNALQKLMDELERPCKDCISRTIVQEEITKSIELKENPHQLWQRIQALPPVQPEQRTGRWIDDKCSVCGKGVEDLISSREWYQNENPKYCPFCGIKIEEVEE